ncbi:MAG: hypothetical protein N3D85_05780 [Candidatus Bathyarchaeota archaeon]|nr:hypothetical protein [Candidatus Bathyarchaeota archaeon]
MMNRHNAIADLEPPKPLRRPEPLNHFPYPNPRINATAAIKPLSSITFFVKENWN